jgi:hypothetical protein
MEAPRILSKSQTQTLESVYIFLRTLRPLLRSLADGVGQESRLHLDSTISLATLNLSRLVEHFPEVADAEKRWQRGGVS